MTKPADVLLARSIAESAPAPRVLCPTYYGSSDHAEKDDRNVWRRAFSDDEVMEEVEALKLEAARIRARQRT